jgi:Uma2 family endonuclease
VSPMGTPEHGWIVGLLLSALLPEAVKRGWRAWPGTVGVSMVGTQALIVPDFTMAPKDAPLWRNRELLSDGLIMVGEVVSPGSVREDREDKPPIYARGGVPLLLVIDPECSPPAVTLYSDPKNGRYTKTTTVTLGEKIHIPEPLDVELDTSIFLDD